MASTLLQLGGSFIFCSFMVVFLLQKGINRFSIPQGKAWISVLFCVSSLILWLGVLIGLHLTTITSNDYLETLNNPAPPANLEIDWAEERSPEWRTTNSMNLAQASFINWGGRFNYINLDGKYQLYEPNEKDYEIRELRLKELNDVDKITQILQIMTFLFLLLPWVGIILLLRQNYLKPIDTLTIGFRSTRKNTRA